MMELKERTDEELELILSVMSMLISGTLVRVSQWYLRVERAKVEIEIEKRYEKRIAENT